VFSLTDPQKGTQHCRARGPMFINV